MKSVTKRISFIAVILIVAAGAFWFFFCQKSTSTENDYKTAQIVRGDLQETVSSTGSLAAEDTVEVGTEVSGTIKNVYVDYNQHVKKGQVLARLKTDLLDASMQDAAATLTKCKADVEVAQVNYNQNKTLFDKGYLAEKEFLPYTTALAAAKASLVSAQASLSRAKTNLSYAVITSPIDGIVLERSVEVGQTVAASFSTPTLFIIAKDLSKMRIKALVDETDISKIKMNQKVNFTVSAYPDKVFTGQVIQIRRQSTTVSNVVNYTVMVSASNNDSLLLPGMTTTIDFVVNEVHDVMLVPNTALKFRPDMSAQRGKKHMKPGNDNAHRPPDNMPSGSAEAHKRLSPDSIDVLLAAKGQGMLWYYDEQKTMKPTKVQILMTGDSTTAIASDKLKEGAVILTGRVVKSKGTSKSTTSKTSSSSKDHPPMMM
jgi:HlyD family secretion protein